MGRDLGFLEDFGLSSELDLFSQKSTLDPGPEDSLALDGSLDFKRESSPELSRADFKPEFSPELRGPRPELGGPRPELGGPRPELSPELNGSRRFLPPLFGLDPPDNFDERELGLFAAA